MQRAGVSQAALAAETGMGAAQMSHLLTGRRRMRLDVFRRIDAALAKMERRAASSRHLGEAARADYDAGVASGFITLDEARALKERPRARMPKIQANRIFKDLDELSNALKKAPKISDLSDDALLGFDKA